ncbi:MAG: hypothetical protein OCC46_07740 [Pseudodesulfovibrio sp.]
MQSEDSKANKTWTYAVIEHKDYIQFLIQGEFSVLNDIIECSEATILAAMNRGHKRVLVDKRVVPPNLGMSGAKALLNRFKSSFVQPVGLHIAAITSPENHHTCKGIEKLLQSIKIDYRAFSNEDEAKEWLISTDSN